MSDQPPPWGILVKICAALSLICLVMGMVTHSPALGIVCLFWAAGAVSQRRAEYREWSNEYNKWLQTPCNPPTEQPKN